MWWIITVLYATDADGGWRSRRICVRAAASAPRTVPWRPSPASPLLNDYLRLAERYGGHTHHVLNAAFAMHDTYRRKGDMRLTDWSEYIKE